MRLCSGKVHAKVKHKKTVDKSKDKRHHYWTDWNAGPGLGLTLYGNCLEEPIGELSTLDHCDCRSLSRFAQVARMAALADEAIPSSWHC